MHTLDLFTILFVGLLVGNEFSVSAFMNPAIWKYNNRSQATALASSLGAFMPGWYALCFFLLTSEAWLYRHTATAPFAITADALWLAVLVFTIALEVPLNNRLIKTPESDQSFDWLSTHRRWDTLHRIRIALVIVAFAVSVWSILTR